MIQFAVPGPLPPNLRYAGGRGGIGRVFRWGLVLAVILAVILLGIYSFWTRTGVAGTLTEVVRPDEGSTFIPTLILDQALTVPSVPGTGPGMNGSPTGTMASTQAQGVISGPQNSTPFPPISPTGDVVACPQPPGWGSYIVQTNDTLFAISLFYNVSLTVLMDANCLETSTIFVGQQLYVPPGEFPVQPPSATGMPPSPVPTSTVSPSQTNPPPSLTPTPPPPSPTQLQPPTETTPEPTIRAELTPVVSTPTQVP